MAVLGTEWIKVRPEDSVGGEPFSFKTEIRVDKNGIFTFTIPAELEETARVHTHDGPTTFVGKMRVNNFVTSKTKADGIKFLTAVAQDYVKCEVIRETVILYTTRANVSYWKTAKGDIVPNGGYDDDYGKNKGSWHGTPAHERGYDSDHTYSVGLMAYVYVKVTARRKSGDQIGWERAGDNCQNEPDNYLDKLNSFVGAGFTDSERDNCHEIPYTEEAARFFYNAMMSICRLSDRIESFFGNEANVKKAIETRTSFMLGGGK